MIETKIIEYPGIISIEIHGRYQISSIRQVEGFFRSQLDKKPEIIAFNLKSLDYLDSSGIGSLLRLYNLSRKNSIQCIFWELNPEILTVFQLSRLDSYLPIYTKEQFEKEILKGLNPLS